MLAASLFGVDRGFEIFPNRWLPVTVHELGLKRFLADDGDGVVWRLLIRGLNEEANYFPLRAIDDAGFDDTGGLVAINDLHIGAHGHGCRMPNLLVAPTADDKIFAFAIAEL